MSIRFFLALATVTMGISVHAQALTDADEIVARANLAAYYAGKDGRSEIRMIIRDAQDRQQRRQFTVLRRDIDDGGDQQFLVVFSQPSDVRNTVFLVDKHIDRDDDRWLYLPGLDLVKRISASD
ncbi:MAG: outer membrane lipoprotein-sorting protein, partial [Gammaproteobacteria bacterium]|nr:outer membrane lipoprotein-sorting protein [Gammaproteobacteria bacterium]